MLQRVFNFKVTTLCMDTLPVILFSAVLTELRWQPKQLDARMNSPAQKWLFRHSPGTVATLCGWVGQTYNLLMSSSFRIQCAKNDHNPFIFDGIIQKIKMWAFFGTQWHLQYSMKSWNWKPATTVNKNWMHQFVGSFVFLIYIVRSWKHAEVQRLNNKSRNTGAVLELLFSRTLQVPLLS